MRLDIEYEARDADDIDAAFHGAARLVRLSVLSGDGELKLTLWLTTAQARALAEKLAQSVPPAGR